MTEHIAESKEYNQKWKDRFGFLKDIEAEKHGPWHASLSTTGRQRLKELRKELGLWRYSKLAFNAWAFFLGPFWYFGSGLWLKGFQVFLLATCWFIAAELLVILDIISLSVARIFDTIPWVYIASRANYDYYMSECHDVKFFGNPEKPGLMSKKSSLLLPLFIVVMMSYLALSGAKTQHSYSQENPQAFYDDISGVWEVEGRQFMLDFRDINSPMLRIGDAQYFNVEIKSLDIENLTLDIAIPFGDGQVEHSTFFMDLRPDGTFYLSMQQEGSNLIPLDFVSKL